MEDKSATCTLYITPDHYLKNALFLGALLSHIFTSIYTSLYVFTMFLVRDIHDIIPNYMLPDGCK